MTNTTMTEQWVRAFTGTMAHLEVSQVEKSERGQIVLKSKTACKLTIWTYWRMNEFAGRSKCPKCLAAR